MFTRQKGTAAIVAALIAVTAMTLGFAANAAIGGDGSATLVHSLQGVRLPHRIKQERIRVRVSMTTDRGRRGRRGPRGLRGPQGPQGAAGAQGAAGPAGHGSSFTKGEGPVNAIDAGSFQTVELHCNPGWTAIADGFDTNDALVVASGMTFDGADPTGGIITVSNLDTVSAQWAAVLTCEQ